MTCYKGKFLGSAAAIAMIAGMPGAAFAFDEVNWVWDKQVTETVDIDIDINALLEPIGLTQVEKLQIQIGDVNASSSVHDIENNQPTEGFAGGPVTVTLDEQHFQVSGDYIDGDPGGDPVEDMVEDNNNAISDVEILPSAGSTLTVVWDPVEGGNVDELDEEFEFDLFVSGEIEVDVPPGEALGPYDAITELPTVESIATAVGNNQSINSDTATMLHDGQFLFDQGDVANGEPGAEDLIGALGAVLAGAALADNTHTAMAGAASVLALTGTINKANVDATSEVYNILNARVDSSATAVGNNISVNVNADGEPTGDSVLIADITQFAAADVSASSNVYNVSVNDYINMGAPEVNPMVSSVATAVGNNVSINVGNVGQ